MASEKRLIDANALLERMNVVTADDTCPLHIAAEIDQEIALAPTVDAVEVVHGRWIPLEYAPVVRCKDCKHYCSFYNECSEPHNHYTEEGFREVHDNDFCSYGERITDNDS